MKTSQNYYIGVDVGTGSARAGIFTDSGVMLGYAANSINTIYPASGQALQSSENIWQAVCGSIKQAIAESDIDKNKIRAIGFDATCSLVISENIDNEKNLDVIVWMDQRAIKEADICSNTNSKPLKYVGGRMSPEMQMPKLLWLKSNRPDLWGKLNNAWDLSDWLTWRATGNNARSNCTLTCKWGYLPYEEDSWDFDFLEKIGLTDVLEKANLPAKANDIGTKIGYLTPQIAKELDLPTDCIVAAGLIDAHAGAVAGFASINEAEYKNSLVLVAGTSNCHMALHNAPQYTKGIWGPYFGAVYPKYWLNEGGQTATGQLLQYLVNQLRGSDSYQPNAHDMVSKEIINRLNTINSDIAPDLHILPDFLGNRSPQANANFRGVISGLGMDDEAENFLKQYWAASCAIAYGTRAIIERLNEDDYEINQIIITGGHAKNPLLCNLYSDACNAKLIIPQVQEPVLLGSAINAVAAFTGDFDYAINNMKSTVEYQMPNVNMLNIHNKRYERFQQLISDYLKFI